MESPKIITIYSNNQIQVKWDSVTGKIKVEPETEWLYPEGVDNGVDYKTLLIKYLTFLESVEGSNLLKRRSDSDGVQFTDEEWEELVRLAGNLD